jgi:acetolactate synthase-1/3 small subunit
MTNEEVKKHILSILVDNQPGVLSRIAGLFSGRGFNIESLVIDFTDTAFVQREMALVKVRAKPEHRAEILRTVDIFRSRVVDAGSQYYIVEVTGDEGKVSAFLNLLRPMGISEIARTGAIALPREKK